MTDRELMQQALKALNDLLQDTQHADHFCGAIEQCPVVSARNALDALRERLAQPEQSPLDRMAENARELGLDYEPVQKEKPDGRQTTGPLTDRTDHVRNGDDYMPEPVGEIVQAFADLTAVSIPVMPPVGTKLYTTPPRREWVGLDRKEMFAIIDQEKADLRTGLPMFWRDQVAIIARAIEAKLKEKNG